MGLSGSGHVGVGDRMTASQGHWAKSLETSVLLSSSMFLGGTARVLGTVLGAEDIAVDRETRSHVNGNDVQVGSVRICQEETYCTWV